jgi:peroxiredoxin (alkyl hydroperoxide reductase subunit C)
LQLADKARIATPADWRPGDKVIIPPSIPDEKAKEMFPQGFETIKPYLRMVQVN